MIFHISNKFCYINITITYNMNSIMYSAKLKEIEAKLGSMNEFTMARTNLRLIVLNFLAWFEKSYASDNNIVWGIAKNIDLIHKDGLFNILTQIYNIDSSDQQYIKIIKQSINDVYIENKLKEYTLKNDKYNNWFLERAQRAILVHNLNRDDTKQYLSLINAFSA